MNVHTMSLLATFHMNFFFFIPVENSGRKGQNLMRADKICDLSDRTVTLQGKG